MFGDINRVELMGNLTSDPELRQTNSGTAVCSVGMATNRRYQSQDEWREETEFHNLVLWAKRAESFVQRTKKGTRVYVEGRLQTRSWDADDGSKRYKTEVVVSRVILIDRYEQGEYQKNAPDQQDTSPSQKSSEKKEEKKNGSSQEEQIDPDDLPF